MFALFLLTIAAKECWTGEFVITVSGKGKVSKPDPWLATWDIHREARGTITLDYSYRGAMLAASPDGKNAERYESWNSTIKRPIRMKINDKMTLYGPLFAPNQIRDDLTLINCPLSGSGAEWQEGKVASPILQLDLKAGTFTFESPRFYAKGQEYFKRSFVKGPASFVSQKPREKTSVDLEYEMVFGLNKPKEWFRIEGKFKPGQQTIDLSGNYPFTVNCGVAIAAQPIKYNLKLVLNRTTM